MPRPPAGLLRCQQVRAVLDGCEHVACSHCAAPVEVPPLPGHDVDRGLNLDQRASCGLYTPRQAVEGVDQRLCSLGEHVVDGLADLFAHGRGTRGERALPFGCQLPLLAEEASDSVVMPLNGPGRSWLRWRRLTGCECLLDGFGVGLESDDVLIATSPSPALIRAPLLGQLGEPLVDLGDKLLFGDDAARAHPSTPGSFDLRPQCGTGPAQSDG